MQRMGRLEVFDETEAWGCSWWGVRDSFPRASVLDKYSSMKTRGISS